MRAAQTVCCTDIKVMRGMNCWAKLRMQHAATTSQQDNGYEGWASCCSLADNKERERQVQPQLGQQSAEQSHISVRSTTDNWATVKLFIEATAEETLGRGRRKQLEWFADSAKVLVSLIEAKNGAYAAYLRTNTQAKKKAL